MKFGLLCPYRSETVQRSDDHDWTSLLVGQCCSPPARRAAVVSARRRGLEQKANMHDENSRSPNLDTLIQRVLSHPKRAEILDYLMRGKDETSEAELVATLGIGDRIVDYHLKVLRDADLIPRLEDGPEGRRTQSLRT